MKSLAILILVSLASVSTNVSAQSKDTRYFELRIYYAAPGKLDALITRFKDHTTGLFEKHGMTNVAYWVPVTNDKNTLYYVMAYPSKEARARSWDGFRNDPQWIDAKNKSEVDGKLVDSVKSIFMYGSDVLPAINAGSAGPDRTFELRIYHCQPGKLPNLKTRFKDHTLKLFENHGMQNIAYFESEVPEGKQADLVYFIAHKSPEAAKKSWADFIADPEWVKVRDASEKDGKILVGIESVYLKPLSFSKIK